MKEYKAAPPMATGRPSTRCVCCPHDISVHTIGRDGFAVCQLSCPCDRKAYFTGVKRR